MDQAQAYYGKASDTVRNRSGAALLLIIVLALVLIYMLYKKGTFSGLLGGFRGRYSINGTSSGAGSTILTTADGSNMAGGGVPLSTSHPQHPSNNPRVPGMQFDLSNVLLDQHSSLDPTAATSSGSYGALGDLYGNLTTPSSSQAGIGVLGDLYGGLGGASVDLTPLSEEMLTQKILEDNLGGY